MSNFDPKNTIESQIGFILGSLQELPKKIDSLEKEVHKFKESQASKNSTIDMGIKAVKDTLNETKKLLAELDNGFYDKEKGCSKQFIDLWHRIENLEKDVISLERKVASVEKAYKNRYAWLKTALISAITSALVVFAQGAAQHFFK